MKPVLKQLLSFAAAGALVIGAATALPFFANGAEAPHVIPAPAQDMAAGGGTETLTLAGGCFWGVQGVFQHVKGVTGAVSGYAGGAQHTAEYETVSGGETGHAETVQISYDPKQVSLGKLLQVYFSVAHDPTQLNRQGPDTGTQYRSAVFPKDDAQAAVVKSYIAQLNQAKVFPAAIVTKIEMKKNFYPAEAYHQDYATLHPREPYIFYNDLPKIENLKKLFPDLYRPDPVLVDAKHAGH